LSVTLSLSRLQFYSCRIAGFTRVPTATVELSEEVANAVLKLVDKLEQDEDVQKVYHNLK